MRENRLSGLEAGVRSIPHPYPNYYPRPTSSASPAKTAITPKGRLDLEFQILDSSFLHIPFALVSLEAVF
jgi:hypothetical protein